MKKLPALVALAAAGLLAGCGSSSEGTDDTASEPDETSATTAAPDPTDAFQPLAVAMVAQSGTYFPNGITGVPFGCSDTLVTIHTVPIETDSPDEHVAAAIEFLLDDSQYYHGAPAVTNSLTLSETLEFVTADVGRDTVDIELSGDLVVRGECEAYRIQAQIYGTAAATGQVDDVSIRLNGTELSEVLGLEPFDVTQVLAVEE